MRVLYYFIVGVLWGCTNPFIKRAQIAISNAEKDCDHKDNDDKDKDRSSADKNSFWRGWEIAHFLRKLLSNPMLVAPFVVNQIGSFIFYILLATGDISTTSPICNALALIFTALTGWYLGEKVNSPFKLFLGVVLVYCGVLLCTKSSSNKSS